MINMDLDDMDTGFKQPQTRIFNDKANNLFGGKVGGSVISGQEIFSMEEPETSRNNQK